MKKFLKFPFLCGALGATVLMSQLSAAHAQAPDAGATAPAQTAPVIRTVGPEVDATVQKTADTMLGALEDNNRGAFVALADDRFKAALTPPIFKSVVDQFGPRLMGGFEAQYLGEMNKAGFVVHLWRLTFSDKGDDMLVQMSFKEGKVGGFFLT